MKTFTDKCVRYLTKMVYIDYEIQVKFNKIEQCAGIVKILFLMNRKIENTL